MGGTHEGTTVAATAAACLSSGGVGEGVRVGEARESTRFEGGALGKEGLGVEHAGGDGEEACRTGERGYVKYN